MQSRRKENKSNFIKAIQTCPFLYDYNHPEYRNKAKSEGKWAQLAEEFGYDDANDAKTTWKNILTAYNKTKAPNFIGADKKPYLFASEMAFMDGIKRNGAPLNFLNLIRPSSSDRSLDHFDEAANLEEEPKYEEPIAKRLKKTEEPADDKTLLQTVGSVMELMVKRESPGELFGRTVAIALDDMPKKVRMQAQLEIQQVLLKYTD